MSVSYVKEEKMAVKHLLRYSSPGSICRRPSTSFSSSLKTTNNLSPPLNLQATLM